MMSNCPPLVAMSVVTLWRRTFSSRITQLILYPVAFSHSGASFCMMIMSPLFTVAMVSSSACAAPVRAIAVAARNAVLSFILVLPR